MDSSNLKKNFLFGIAIVLLLGTVNAAVASDINLSIVNPPIIINKDMNMQIDWTSDANIIYASWGTDGNVTYTDANVAGGSIYWATVNFANPGNEQFVITIQNSDGNATFTSEVFVVYEVDPSNFDLNNTSISNAVNNGFTFGEGVTSGLSTQGSSIGTIMAVTLVAILALGILALVFKTLLGAVLKLLKDVIGSIRGWI